MICWRACTKYCRSRWAASTVFVEGQGRENAGFSTFHESLGIPFHPPMGRRRFNMNTQGEAKQKHTSQLNLVLPLCHDFRHEPVTSLLVSIPLVHALLPFKFRLFLAQQLQLRLHGMTHRTENLRKPMKDHQNRIKKIMQQPIQPHHQHPFGVESATCHGTLELPA